MRNLRFTALLSPSLLPRLLFYNSNPWRSMGYPNYWEEEVNWCSRWVPTVWYHTPNKRTHEAFTLVSGVHPDLVFVPYRFLFHLFQRWLTRRATSFSTEPISWTAPRTFTQQELSSSTAGPWTCMRLGSNTLSPKAPLTRPSISWYVPHQVVWVFQPVADVGQQTFPHPGHCDFIGCMCCIENST